MAIYDNWLKAVYTLMLLIICHLYLVGQQYTYAFRQLTSELTEPRYNWYIHQDRHHLVWLSSIAGLNRFDGEEVKHYRPNREAQHALRSVYASQSSFFEDQMGRLWFTEDEALISYDYENDHFNRFYAQIPEGDTIVSGYGWAHLEPTTQQLWFQVEQYLFSCDTRGTATKVKYRGKAPSQERLALYHHTGGHYRLFAAADQELLIRQYDQALEQTKEWLLPINGFKIHQILPVSDNLAWVATDDGLYELNVPDQEFIKQEDQWQNTFVGGASYLTVMDDSRLLVGTSDNGIYIFDTKDRTYTGKISALVDGNIQPFTPNLNTIYLDPDNNLWISTMDEGVLYTNLKRPKFRMFLPNHPILALCETGKGEILAASADRVYRINNHRVVGSIPLPKSGGDFENPRFIRQDENGNLWLGTESALLVKPAEKNHFSIFSKIPPAAKNKQVFTSMTCLPDGRLLFACTKAAPFIIQPDLQTYQSIDNVPINTSFLEYAEGYLFFYNTNSELRIARLSGEAIVVDTLISPLPIVNAIRFSPKENRYFVATDDGLYHLTRNAASGWRLTPDSILEERSINSLLLDHQQQLWIGTPQGLLRYEQKNGQQHYFQESDGILSPYFNRSASLTTATGEFFFGSSQGLSSFYPNEVRSEIPPPRPAITRIRINQEEGNLKAYNKAHINNPLLVEHLEVPFAKSNLSFHLAAREYSGACTFIFQLLGGSSAQIDTLSNSNILQFNSLREGKYQLNIWAINADGVRSENGRQLQITVFPPWQRTSWFYTAVLLLMAFIFYQLYQYRLRFITEAKNAELAKVAAELKEAEALRKFSIAEQQKAETENAVLRLQMNPHFIFNGLNTIDAFILKKEPTKARQILVRFAKLMRRILDNSEEQLVSIHEEVQFLDEYLLLEGQRFPDRMSYAFHIDPNIDQHEAYIPTMILQPFVENAIIHGLRPKSGKGHIQINFLLDETTQQVICEVQDNGVGRKIQSSNNNHVSKATSITQRRLEVIATTYSLTPPPQLAIIDQTDDQGLPAGTTVRLYFPLID